MICGIIDPENTTLPMISKTQIVKAERLFVASEEMQEQYIDLWIILVLIAVVFTLIIFVTGFVTWSRRKTKSICKQKKSLELIIKESEKRYTEFPKKTPS